jgi:hypothetical protein
MPSSRAQNRQNNFISKVGLWTKADSVIDFDDLTRRHEESQ